MNTRRVVLLALLLLPGRPVWAVDVKLPGKDRSLRVGITQTLITEYHSDVDVLTGNESPSYFDVKNRTGIVLQHGTTSFNLRFDAQKFFNAPAEGFNNITYEDQYSLEKITLSSTQRSFEITTGDFSVRLGRGMALDLTRVDEMFRDTTLRGMQLRMTTPYVDGQGFGGWVNPLQTDDFTESSVRIPADVIGGARIEVRPSRLIALGMHYTGGGLQARSGKTRDANHILGGSVELPSLWGWLSTYAEFDFMRRAQENDVLSGHGTYFSLTASRGPFAALVEFKFYRYFQFVNVFGDSPWDIQVYHRPPTLMWEKAEVINNHDVIGARGRLDYRFESVGSNFWASYGHFFRSDAGPEIDFFTSGATINDVFGGLQQMFRAGALDVTGGYRIDQLDNQDGETVTDFSQAFVEVELALAVASGHSLESEILYRKVQKSAQAFSEFHISLGYRPSRWFGASATYEYSNEVTDTDPEDGIGVRNHFGGGTGTLYFTSSSYFRVFGGTTRGGMRCVDGFCREISPFMGVRAELVLQF